VRAKRLDLIGQQFGAVRVRARGTKTRYWRCRCDRCEHEFEARGSRLIACQIQCICQQPVQHGHARRGKQSPEYKKWRGMRARVRYDKNYADVSLDPRWESFENFLADMGPMPDGSSLDRMNPFFGYGPDNCRWAPPDVQAANKRGAGLLRYDFSFNGASGKRYCGAVGTAAEWAWYLRRVTGNESWTTARLRDMFSVLSLEEILKTACSWGVPAEELSWIAGPEFRGMWDSYQREAYLQAA
jgi:hypothetical protein